MDWVNELVSEDDGVGSSVVLELPSHFDRVIPWLIGLSACNELFLESAFVDRRAFYATFVIVG